MAAHGTPRGDWKYECPRCASVVWASTVRKEWTGLRVCRDCYDPKHPQLNVRGRRDNQNVPFSRPPSDSFYYPFGEPQQVTALEDGQPLYLVDSEGALLVE